jgi:hypothetical protein
MAKALMTDSAFFPDAEAQDRFAGAAEVPKQGNWIAFAFDIVQAFGLTIV